MYGFCVLGGSKEGYRLGHRVGLSCALAHLARQNNTLCCFENTLLAVRCGNNYFKYFSLLYVATIVISSVRMWYNEIGQKAK